MMRVFDVEVEFFRIVNRLPSAEYIRMHKVNLSLQIIPVNEANAYPMIDEAIRVIQNSGLRYEVQPFATIIEGSYEEVLAVATAAKDAALTAGASELVVNIQVHLKKEKDVVFEEKTQKFK